MGKIPLEKLKIRLSKKHNLKKSSSWFGRLLSKSTNHEEDFFSNFVCFSESPNFIKGNWDFKRIYPISVQLITELFWEIFAHFCDFFVSFKKNM